jgi:hypothetical protein
MGEWRRLPAGVALGVGRKHRMQNIDQQWDWLLGAEFSGAALLVLPFLLAGAVGAALASFTTWVEDRLAAGGRSGEQPHGRCAPGAASPAYDASVPIGGRRSWAGLPSRADRSSGRAPGNPE